MNINLCALLKQGTRLMNELGDQPRQGGASTCSNRIEPTKKKDLPFGKSFFLAGYIGGG